MLLLLLLLLLLFLSDHSHTEATVFEPRFQLQLNLFLGGKIPSPGHRIGIGEIPAFLGFSGSLGLYPNKHRRSSGRHVFLHG